MLQLRFIHFPIETKDSFLVYSPEDNDFTLFINHKIINNQDRFMKALSGAIVKLENLGVTDPLQMNYLADQNLKASKYKQILMMLLESGINFGEVPREEILRICESYTGKIDQDIYKMALDVIDSFYACDKEVHTCI